MNCRPRRRSRRSTSCSWTSRATTRVCEAGTVEVTSLMTIERYSHVMHMVSHVVGRLRPDVTAYDALRAYFPHGTVTGAPKIERWR